MRRLLYGLALLVVCGMTAPLAWATTANRSTTGSAAAKGLELGMAFSASTGASRADDTSDPGPQVELGAVRSNTGTLYSVENNGGTSSVSTVETAGWNTCTPGYSLVGYDFDQNGFWLCARNDLAASMFYVGNVVNDAGYWWQVQGGSATSDGNEGWNYCPSSATLLGTEFNSNGFWVCYVPPPAPSGGGTTTVVPPPVSSPPPSKPKPKRPRRHVHVRIVLRWVWEGAHTWLTGLQFARLPRKATVIVTCRGKGCPRTPMRSDVHHLPTLRSRLLHHRYRRGDHITIRVTVPGAIPEVASIVIRNGRKPRAGLRAP